MKCPSCGEELVGVVVKSEKLDEVWNVFKRDEKFENIFKRGFAIRVDEKRSFITGVFCQNCQHSFIWRMGLDGKLEILEEKKAVVVCSLEKCPFPTKECITKSGEAEHVCIYGSKVENV